MFCVHVEKQSCACRWCTVMICRYACVSFVIDRQYWWIDSLKLVSVSRRKLVNPRSLVVQFCDICIAVDDKFIAVLCCDCDCLLTLSLPIPLRLYALPYWPNPPFVNFWYSDALALRSEHQSARMSKIKNDGLDQYGAETSKQQQFGTRGVEGVNTVYLFSQQEHIHWRQFYGSFFIRLWIMSSWKL